jgi:hypothetical protein
MNKWLGRIEGMVTSATAGMTEEQFRWHPEGKWSAAQILDHLSKTYKGTVIGFERAIATNRSLATRSKGLQPRFARFLLLRLGYFPPGRKSPERVLPGRDCPGEHTRITLLGELSKLIQAHAKVEKAFSRVKVADHPVLGPLTPGQWSRFHYVHARHHMKQIAKLRQQMATGRSASA